ncbi:N-acetyltransferase ESCO2 [Acridotheres tristis]
MKKSLDSGIPGIRNSWIQVPWNHKSLDPGIPGPASVPGSDPSFLFFFFFFLPQLLLRIPDPGVQTAPSFSQIPIPEFPLEFPGEAPGFPDPVVSQLRGGKAGEGNFSREIRAFPETAHPRGKSGNSREFPTCSPHSQLPVGAFYGKRTYLDPLERKRLRELLGDGNVLGKTGNSGNPGRNSGNPGRNSGNSGRNPGRNSGNSSRNPSRNRSSKGKANAKARQEIPKGKSVGNSQNSNVRNIGNSQNSNVGNSQNSNVGNSQNSVLQKRPEFRVLSAGVRPALRLPLGSAFFLSRKKSGKTRETPEPIPGKTSADSGADAKNLPEKSGKEEKSGLEEGKENSGKAREEEKENRECGNEGQEEIARKSPGNCEGKEESPGIPPSPSPDSRDSGPKKDLGSPCPAGLFPIFLPTRRRPLEELPAPFAIGPSGKAPRKSKESSQHSLDQMIIDAGQRQLGALQCGSCGMLYDPGIPEDRIQHLRHHRRLQQGLAYPGWKKERVVGEFWDGKIVLILPGDPKYAVGKAQEVLALVDSELGFPAGSPRCPEPSRPRSRPRSRPHSRIFPEQSHVYLFCRDPLRAWRCSLEAEPAVCGISRIWVLGSQRRRGIARRMVDTLRRTFVFGAVLNSRDLAFSDPTPDGRGFAARYCGRADFLVYSPLPPGAPGSLGAPGSDHWELRELRDRDHWDQQDHWDWVQISGIRISRIRISGIPGIRISRIRIIGISGISGIGISRFRIIGIIRISGIIGIRIIGIRVLKPSLSS